MSKVTECPLLKEKDDRIRLLEAKLIAKNQSISTLVDQLNQHGLVDIPPYKDLSGIG